VCGECGQLAWPDEAAATLPHRRGADDRAHGRPDCTHCGQDSWIDLGRESTALALRQGETLEARAATTGHTRVLGQVSLGAVVGGFIGVIAAGLTWPAAIVTVCAGAAAGLSAAAQARRLLPGPRTLPDRWSLALPPSGAARDVTGPAEATEELVRAPLSGRMCVAYEVGLRRDASPDDSLNEWALLEQRVAPMRIGDTEVDPARTFVDLPRQLHGRLGEVDVDDAAVTYLRDRGFSMQGCSLYAFENVLEPQEPVVLSTMESGAVLRRPN